MIDFAATGLWTKQTPYILTPELFYYWKALGKKSECYHSGIYSIIKIMCILKFNLWLRLLRVQENGLCWPGLWMLVSLSVNWRAFPTGRRASGDTSFSIIRTWAAQIVLVSWGSGYWSGCGFGFLLKVCDYYSQVSNCDLQMLGAAPVYVF